MDKCQLISEASPFDSDVVDAGALLSTNENSSHNSPTNPVPEIDSFSSDDDNETDEEDFDEKEHSVLENSFKEFTDEALSQGGEKTS